MKIAGALLMIAAVAAPMSADVRLTIRPDGSKVIYNVGSDRRTSDAQWLVKQRNRRSGFDAYIERYASLYGVDPVLVRAVILVESDFDPRCVSRKGARGLMQLMPDTAKRYGVSRVHDPEENIRGGVRYLADLLTLFNSDLRRALAAYNAGEGAVTRFNGIPPYQETSDYVRKTLTVYYGRPYGGGESYPARAGGPKLRGGFPTAVAEPIAILPGMRYLGTR